MEKSKKSVLFICADQWRFDCFSFLNHPYALTPNLDKLAKQSENMTDMRKPLQDKAKKGPDMQNLLQNEKDSEYGSLKRLFLHGSGEKIGNDNK